MSAEPTVRHKATAWSLVAVQAALLAGIVLASPGPGWQQTRLTDLIGTTSTIAALTIGLWSAAYLKRGLTPSPLPNGATELVTRGPYRWVRHPMYTAVMLFSAGAAIRSGGWLIAGLATLLVGFLTIKARWEETRLVQAFAGYQAYAASTPRFLRFRTPTTNNDLTMPLT